MSDANLRMLDDFVGQTLAQELRTDAARLD